MDAWELLFSQSKLNGGEYYGDLLPTQAWDFPKGTWFQQRLAKVRGEQSKTSESDPT